MTAQHAFLFDARFCSGCKACQAACKDKNGLPAGVLWRRVMEITGGTWQQEGNAWNHSVFAYNFSIACNHCLHPKCAGICPVNAYTVREDGIVILDESKCMGCGYCAWGCPYGAPQYNPDAGHMTKCDFCFDNLDQGLAPACVAACPLRALEYQEMETPSTDGNEIRVWEVPSGTHPYPLPEFSHTQPRLAIKLHAAMSRPDEKHLANLEEVQSRRPSAWEDAPLILFTLLGQMAVGGLWALGWMFPSLWAALQYDEAYLQLLPTLIVGLLLGAAMLASLAHLGTKKNAWRVFSNLRRSSLSKEVLFTGIFGASLCIILLGIFLHQDLTLGWAFASAAGLGLIYNMAQVYRIPAAPGWNTWRTNAGFVISALLLGVSVMLPVLAYESSITGIRVAPGQQITTGTLMVILLIGQLSILPNRKEQSATLKARMGLILLGIALVVMISFQPGIGHFWYGVSILLVSLSEETLGRWFFYRSRI